MVHALGRRTPAELLEMPIEALELGEEPDVERMPIEDPDGVVRIGCRHEPVARVGNRLQMPRRNEAGNTGDREVFHISLSVAPCCWRIAYSRPAADASTAASFGAVTFNE